MVAHVHVCGAAFAWSDAVPLFESVDLHFAPGWHGLVGANGSGKSTLLRIVAGQLEPERGEVRVEPADACVVLCEQSVDRLGDDVIALAARGDREAFRLRASLALDPPMLSRWPTLSPGERKRWQIGGALARSPDVLLLDEPTNHLDHDGRALLVAALRRFRGAGVIVSHDRALLDELTTATVRLDARRAREWTGGYSEARDAWTREAQASREERERRSSVVRATKRSLDAARRDRAAAEATRSTKNRMRNAHDSDARTSTAGQRAEWGDRVHGRSVAIRRGELARAESALASLAPIEKERGRPVLVGFEPSPRAHVLSIDVDTLRAGEHAVLHDVRRTLGREDRVRLVGPNGSGKTTLLRALVQGRERVLFVPQEIDEADTRLALTALRHLPNGQKGDAMSLIAALGADPSRLLASERPSPGEARKLAIAIGLAKHVHAVVLDEPTNHLDLPSIERLEEALDRYPGALLVVTHDDAFAERVTTTEWRIERGRVVP